MVFNTIIIFIIFTIQDYLNKGTVLSLVLLLYQKEGRKEMFILFNDALNTFYFMVIWRHTYDKGPLR